MIPMTSPRHPPSLLDRFHSVRSRCCPFAFSIGLLLSAWLSAATNETVVLYCGQDQPVAEPILREFHRQTGIRVLPVWDTEAVKSVGLANRLAAERAHPRADVYWNNEAFRVQTLAREGVVTIVHPEAVATRYRVLVINTNRIPLERAPRSLLQLTNSAWDRRLALAYPLFGSTSTHFLALRLAWGQPRFKEWCQALNANHPLLVDGNSSAAALVASGEVWMALTDSDDIRAVQRERAAPVVSAPPEDQPWPLHACVARVIGGPHPGPGERLARYLTSREVALALVRDGAFDRVEDATAAEASRPDWERMATALEPTTRTLKEVFAR